MNLSGGTRCQLFISFIYLGILTHSITELYRGFDRRRYSGYLVVEKVKGVLTLNLERILRMKN